MVYKILADIIMMIHFAWILFMIVGFIFTLGGFIWKRYFDRWIFRTVHLLGILFVVILAILGEYCPLTILENNLVAKYDPSLTYPGSFIAHNIEKLVYPEVSPVIIIVPTIIIGLITLVVYIIKPPMRIVEILKLRKV